MTSHTLDHVYTILRNHFGKRLVDSERHGFELSVIFTPEDIIEAITFLRDHKDTQFRQLTDLCGVDYLGERPRFQVVYHLLSYKYNLRIRIKVKVDEGHSLPSLCNIYSAANWYEREVFDLYGIPFDGHPDLRRLLTDYNFDGHPLRKDFPLSGFVEPRYDSEEQRVVYNPVKLPQEYRNFDALSPWEGMTPDLHLKVPGSHLGGHSLPGDEKATQPNDQNPADQKGP